MPQGYRRYKGPVDRYMGIAYSTVAGQPNRPVGVGNLATPATPVTPVTPATPVTPFQNVQSKVGSEGGFPTPAALELPMNAQNQFTNLLQKPQFDVVSPWQSMAQQDVQTGYQDTLAKNAAMQGTGLTQAREGLAMSGGVSAQQTARLAERAAQNKSFNDQLAEQQRQQNQLKVKVSGEEMGKEQEAYLGQQGLETDLKNQQTSIGTIGSMNEYIAKLVEEALKRQQGKDMGAAV